VIVWPGPFRTRHLCFASEPGRRGSRVNSRRSPLQCSRRSQPTSSRLSPLSTGLTPLASRVHSLSPCSRARRRHLSPPRSPKEGTDPDSPRARPPRRWQRVAGTASALLHRCPRRLLWLGAECVSCRGRPLHLSAFSLSAPPRSCSVGR
jgi:hypothetical protein